MIGSLLISKNPAVTEAKMIYINASGIITTGTTELTSVYHPVSGPDVVISANDDVTINGNGNCNVNPVTITFSGTVHFKSLQILFCAIVTHEALLPNDVISESPWLTESGQAKKVEIMLTENLVLSDGGRIDVDGKGFPRGNNTSPYHYGPSGGGGKITTTSNVASGGGGNNGSGGIGYTPHDTSCPAMDCGGAGGEGFPLMLANNHVFIHGSGAGYAGQTTNKGGAGGGRVHLKIKGQIVIFENSFISANGTDGVTGNTNNHPFVSGGGGGGTIWLEINPYGFNFDKDTYTFPASVKRSTLPTPATKTYNVVQAATDGKITIAPTIGLTPTRLRNMRANGGSGFYNKDNLIGGPGGGGEIFVTEIQKQTEEEVKIVKTLSPVARNNSNNILFNPYALKAGDIIKIVLNISQVKEPITITDSVLKIPYGPNSNTGNNFRCDPNDNDSKIPLPHISDSGSYSSETGNVIWPGLIPLGDGTRSVYYYCKIKSGT